MLSTIIINNKTYAGKNIIVTNGRVIIDGNDVTPETKEINISVQGDIDKLSVDSCQKVEVKGNVNKLSTTSGSVQCGDVTGDIETTSGKVECKNVGGDIETTSGSVTCDNISGSVETISGSIRRG